MKIFAIAGVLSILSLYINWSKKRVSPALDEKERGLRKRTRVFVGNALEAAITLILLYALVAGLVFHHLPQPGGLAVLLILGAVAYGSRFVADYYYRTKCR